MILHKNLIISFFIIFFSTSVTYCSRGDLCWKEWQSIGLDNRNILSIIYSDKTKKIIAGTDSGLYVYDPPNWLYIEGITGPIIDIAEAENGEIVVAVGKYSGIDGEKIYIGKKIADAPYYELSLIDIFKNPQSVAIKGENGDIVYVGSGNTIAMSTKNSQGEFSEFSNIKTPNNCFGSENPVCADLYIIDLTGELVAGGYDSVPQPEKAQFLKMNFDSMEAVGNFNIISIKEKCFYMVQTLSMEDAIYIATIDSGVYYTEDIYEEWENLPHLSTIPFPVTQAIKQLCVIPVAIPTYKVKKYISEQEAITMVVNSKDIYYFWEFDGWMWNKIDTIPSTLNCICYQTRLFPVVYEDFNLYIGTKSGVYTNYFYMVGVHVNDNPLLSRNDNNLAFFKNENNSFMVAYTSKAAKNISLEILDIKGRIIGKPIKRYCSEGTHYFPISQKNGRLNNGIYIIRLTTDIGQVYKKFMLVQ